MDGKHGEREITRRRLVAIGGAAVGGAMLAQVPLARAKKVKADPPATVYYGPAGALAEEERALADNRGCRYLSAFAGSGTACMFVHGGGWVANQWAVTVKYAERLAVAGVPVFHVNYRDAGKTTGAFPMEVEDVSAALAWVRANAAAYGGNPERIVIVSGSAGANLACLVAAEQQVAGLVAFSGIYDLQTLIAAMEEETITAIRFVGQTQEALQQTCVKAIRRYRGFPPANTPEAIAVQRAYSPVLLPARAERYLLISCREDLVPLEQPEAMVGHTGGELLIAPVSGHSFPTLWNAEVAPSLSGEKAVLDFIASV